MLKVLVIWILVTVLLSIISYVRSERHSRLMGWKTGEKVDEKYILKFIDPVRFLEVLPKRDDFDVDKVLVDLDLSSTIVRISSYKDFNNLNAAELFFKHLENKFLNTKVWKRLEHVDDTPLALRCSVFHKPPEFLTILLTETNMGYSVSVSITNYKIYKKFQDDLEEKNFINSQHIH